MALPSGLQTFANCLMIMSAVVWSSNSIQRIGEDWDILVEIILMSELNLSSLSRNSFAASFLMSLYLGSLMSSMMGLADKCSGSIGFRPTLLLADLRISLSLSSSGFFSGLGWLFMRGGC